MTQEERNEQIIEMMSILSEPMRIKILLEIASCKELRGKDILERFSVTQPTMSHHMNILTTGGLVEMRKEGRCIWYSINKNNLAAVKDIIIQIADGRGVTAASSSRSKPVVRKPVVKKPATSKVDSTASLKKEYAERIAPALKKQFNYTSTMQIPVLKKIVINQGLGMATADKKIIEVAINEITAITGQKAVATVSKKDVANFKLRKKMPIGVMVTLRRERMYEFLEKLVRVAHF